MIIFQNVKTRDLLKQVMPYYGIDMRRREIKYEVGDLKVLSNI